MRKKSKLWSVVALALLPAAALAQHNNTPITPPHGTLIRTLIDTFKNRGGTRGIESFLHGQDRANAASKSGDPHAAAHADQNGLPARGVPTFQILDIGTLGEDALGSDLNDAGQITGSSYTAEGGLHAFLYTDGEMTDLGTLGGPGSYSGGYALNESGNVTGESVNADGFAHAFLYSNGTMRDLGTLGGTTSLGNSINDAGQVTGSAWAGAPPDFEYYAFLYSNGAMKNLGTLGDSYSTGLAIDDAGDVAGYYQRESESHAFLYSGGTMIDIAPSGTSFTSIRPGHPLNAAAHMTGVYRPSGDNRAFLFRYGALTNLGTLGGQSSDGFAINDADQVTGDSTTSSGEAHAFLWSEGAMQDLGTLGGDSSVGWAINSSGQVTGESATAAGSVNPFVYVGGRMVLLDISVLGGLAGSGLDINNSGQVLGDYVVSTGVPGETQVRAFLATPISLLFSQLLAKTRGIGPGRSLSNKVRAADAYYAVPDVQAACAALAGFVQEVEAQSSKKVAQHTADELIADAESIERALGC